MGSDSCLDDPTDGSAAVSHQGLNGLLQEAFMEVYQLHCALQQQCKQASDPPVLLDERSRLTTYNDGMDNW